jgi:hypothetical protein
LGASAAEAMKIGFFLPVKRANGETDDVDGRRSAGSCESGAPAVARRPFADQRETSARALRLFYFAHWTGFAVRC